MTTIKPREDITGPSAIAPLDDSSLSSDVDGRPVPGVPPQEEGDANEDLTKSQKLPDGDEPTANTIPVTGLRMPIFSNLLRQAHVVRGFDTKTKQLHLFLGNETQAVPQGNEITWTFDSTTHELRCFCHELQKLKGNFRPPPEAMIKAYKPKPVSILQAAQKFSICRRQLMRWKASGAIALHSADGNVRTHVDERQVRKLAKSTRGRSRVQKSVMFAENCKKNRVDPKRTLEKILLGTPDPAAKHEVYDIELGAAALRLALESQSEFLLYLSEQKEPDGTFASEIARLLGPKSSLLVKEQTPTKDVQAHWSVWKSMILQGRAPTSGLREDTFESLRDKCSRSKPSYLEKLHCTDLPAWAETSIVGFRRSNKVKSSIKRLISRAAENPELSAFLAIARRSVEEMKPSAAIQLPENYKRVHSDSPKSDSDRFPFEAEQIKELTEYLVKHFKLRRRTANDYLWGHFYSIHNDRLAEMRQMSPDWVGSATAKKLSRAVVNRMFDSSRSARF